MDPKDEYYEIIKGSISSTGRICIVGMGSEFSGDDGIGVYFVRELERVLSPTPSRLLILPVGTVPENFLGKIISFAPDQIIIVDVFMPSIEEKDSDSIIILDSFEIIE